MKKEELIKILESYKGNAEIEIVIDSKPYYFDVYNDVKTKGKKLISLIPVGFKG